MRVYNITSQRPQIWSFSRGIEELVATYHITTTTNFSWYKSSQEIQHILWKMILKLLWKMIQNNGILELL